MNWYKIAILERSQEERDKINDDFIKELTDEYRKVWTPVDSSFVHEVSYNENSKILKVKIRSQGTIRTYKFINVPKNIYDNFMAAPSKGNFFNNIIKRKFDNKRVASYYDSYIDIGHHPKGNETEVSIWGMDRHGNITSKSTKDSFSEGHDAFELVSEESEIASGRFDHETKECSIVINSQYYCKLYERSIEWIKSLLKEHFGNDITMVQF